MTPLPDLTFNQTTPSSAIGGTSRTGGAATGDFFSNRPAADNLNFAGSFKTTSNSLLMLGGALLVVALIMRAKK